VSIYVCHLSPFADPESGHCDGGVGAHAIGQTSAEVSTLDPQNNVLLRIIDWVENGNAPITVTGTKYINVSFETT
jgi:feruloyl esterase